MKKIFFWCICMWIAHTVQIQVQAQTKPENNAGNKDQDKPLIDPYNATYFLSLEKQGRVKRIRFYVGDKITITFKGSRERTTYTITKLKKDTLELANTYVDLSKIGKITLYSESGLRKQLSFYLPIAGGLFFLGDMINPILSGREGFQIRPGSIIVPSILIGTGLVLKAFSKRTLKLNKNRYLRVLEKI